jgi:hypothetical protein
VNFSLCQVDKIEHPKAWGFYHVIASIRGQIFFFLMKFLFAN